MKISPYKIRLVIAGIIGILSILAIYGIFYPLDFLSLQFVPLIQRIIIDFSVIALLLLIFIILLTLIFGRFYCSIICPLGILQEFFLFLEKKENIKQGNFGYKYLISGLAFGILFGGSVLLIRYIDPYSIFCSGFSFAIIGIILLISILVLTFFKGRFFCTNICPVGAILGIFSKYSLYKIYIDKEKCISCKMCLNNCPAGCIDVENKFVDNETCIKCLKCLNVCKNNAVKYGIKPVKFNLKRRDFIWQTGALALIGAGYFAGINFAKNTAKKFKNIILPPGAENPNRMLNKCLNCNLCVSNCPNKILVKADNNFNAVHIDYSKGAKFCKYNCIECSRVCPSGAIKKITYREKKRTKIASAVVKNNCAQCGKCATVCPKDAIIWHSGQNAIIDDTKCIGCGKCAKICNYKAIKIFNEEK